MKSERTIMDILSTYDVVGTYRATARLCGCSPNTVKKFVTRRALDNPQEIGRGVGKSIIDPFVDEITELIAGSNGDIQARVVFDKIVANGYTGSRRTCEWTVRVIKDSWRMSHQRVSKPVVAAPGKWLQYDFGSGPVIDGHASVLFAARLPWSRARFVMALVDKTTPSVIAALDAAFRYFGGVPSLVLTDNEKTVTADHVCQLPVRNQKIVTAAAHYGVSIHTCVPYDPQTKGGVENTVKIAKADLVPTTTNLRDQYASFAELQHACTQFTEKINATIHSAGFIPGVRLEKERQYLHPVPDQPYLLAIGDRRQVPKNTPMISFQHAQY